MARQRRGQGLGFNVFGKYRYVSVSEEEIITEVSKLQSNGQCCTDTPYQDNGFWGQLCHSLSIPNNFNNRKRLHKISSLTNKAEHSIPVESVSDEKLYCVCKLPNTSEAYAQCDKCKDWFHPRCVGFKSIEDIKVISPWLCPDCSTRKARRPIQRTKLSFGNPDSPQTLDIKEAVEEEDEEKDDTLEGKVQAKDCPTKFQLTLSKDEWSKIKPRKRQGYRVLKHGWTDILSEKDEQLCSVFLL